MAEGVGLRRLICLAALGGIVAVCGGGDEGGDPAASRVSLVAWNGNFVEPARPVLLRPGEVPRSFGPAALEYSLLRLSPDGSLVAAIVSGRREEPEPALVVFPVELDSGTTEIEVEAVSVQDLAWSRDGAYLAVVRATSVLLFHTEDWDTAGAYDARGRLFGPIDGDIWAPDSSAIAVGLSDGIVVLRPGRPPEVLSFTDAPFSPRAAAFAGWFGGEVMVRDLADGVFYSHPAGVPREGGWQATIPADPHANFVASLERGVEALYGRLPAATIATTRPTADRAGVLVAGWQAASEAELTRGPFASVVVIVTTDALPTVFDLGKVESIGLVREGRLVDGVVVP